MIILSISTIPTQYAQSPSTITGSTNLPSTAGSWILQWSHTYGGYGHSEFAQPVGDIDEDGINEIIVGGYEILGNGIARILSYDASLATYIEEYSWTHGGGTCNTPSGATILDLNGDGDLELVVSWVYSGTNDGVRAYDWDGKILEELDHYYASFVFDVHAGDYDDDGDLEVLVANAPWGGTPYHVIALGWQDDHFVEESKWRLDNYNWECPMTWSGDTDNDGKTEVVAVISDGATSTAGTWALNWNPATGEWEEELVYDVLIGGGTHYGVVIGDVNRDGTPEIGIGSNTGHVGAAAALFEWNGIEYEQVWQGNWNGEYAVIEALAIGDVDNDGENEFVVGGGNIHVIGWIESNYVEEATITETSGLLSSVVIGDCDTDGLNELKACDILGYGPGSEWIFKYIETSIYSDYLKKPYRLANFDLIEDWVWRNCVPLLLLNSKGLDADKALQNPEHRPEWYYRVVVDEANKRFCVQLIAHWDYQYAGKCAFMGHPWDYEPIFLYYSYFNDFYTSLEANEVKYEYVFCPVGHGNVELGGSRGTDCGLSEDSKLYFWEDENGNKHPVFSLGVSLEAKGIGIISSGIVTSWVGHAYGYLKREVLVMKAENFLERAEWYGYEEFWPKDKKFDGNFRRYVQHLNDSVIEEWSSRPENPFKMLPMYSDESGPSHDLIDPWNSLYEDEYPSVGEAFNPNSFFYLDINYTISSSPEEGKWSEGYSYTSVEADKLTFYLNWEGDVDLDLHLWLGEEDVKFAGTHVGKNYEEERIENELEGYEIDGTYLKVEYSGNTKPERITITAYRYLGKHRIKTKVPSLSFVVHVYTRKAGEDPSFLLVSECLDESTIEKQVSLPQGELHEYSIHWEGKDYTVVILSNASISSFDFNIFEKEISFNASQGIGESFCNVTIPRELLRDNATHPWEVIVDGASIDYTVNYNKTYSFLYFEFAGEEVKIRIRGAEVIPEFPTLLLLVLLAWTVAVLSKKFSGKT